MVRGRTRGSLSLADGDGCESNRRRIESQLSDDVHHRPVPLVDTGMDAGRFRDSRNPPAGRDLTGQRAGRAVHLEPGDWYSFSFPLREADEVPSTHNEQGALSMVRAVSGGCAGGTIGWITDVDRLNGRDGGKGWWWCRTGSQTSGAAPESPPRSTGLTCVVDGCAVFRWRPSRG